MDLLWLLYSLKEGIFPSLPGTFCGKSRCSFIEVWPFPHSFFFLLPRYFFCSSFGRVIFCFFQVYRWSSLSLFHLILQALRTEEKLCWIRPRSISTASCSVTWKLNYVLQFYMYCFPKMLILLEPAWLCLMTIAGQFFCFLQKFLQDYMLIALVWSHQSQWNLTLKYLGTVVDIAVKVF